MVVWRQVPVQGEKQRRAKPVEESNFPRAFKEFLVIHGVVDYPDIFDIEAEHHEDEQCDLDLQVEWPVWAIAPH